MSERIRKALLRLLDRMAYGCTVPVVQALPYPSAPTRPSVEIALQVVVGRHTSVLTPEISADECGLMARKCEVSSNLPAL
jgi:hypothetical protein